MASFKAFATGVQVNGETVLSVVDGMSYFKQKALDILSAHGIEEPRAGHWYPQQGWLDAFREISAEIGRSTLYTIGTKIPSHAQFPPTIDNIDKALSAIDVAYHMNHTGGEIGEYRFEKTGPNSARIICRNPYPCEFDRGIIQAMAKKFKPASSNYLIVEHDKACPCRDRGADSCTFNVSW